MFDPLKRLPLDPKQKRILYLVIACTGVLLIILLVLYFGNPQESSYLLDGDQPDNAVNGLAWSIFLRLIAVVGLIYLIFFVYRWWQSKNPLVAQKRMLIKESIRMSPKQTVHILEVDGKEFLIGATDSQVRILKELGLATEENGLELESGAGSDTDFEAVLQESLETKDHDFIR